MAEIDIKEIVRNAVDLHFHIGPEIIPRKYTAGSLAKAMGGKIGGFALKNHYFPTTPMIRQSEQVSRRQAADAGQAKRPLMIGSVTLNWSVGGLNPEAVKSCASLTDKPIIIWFPTISAKNYLDKSEFEIRPEWVGESSFQPRESSSLKGISVLDDGELSDEALSVLEAIKECRGVLATGHISWQEAEKLAEKALEMEIKVIITHPIYQLIDMPLSVQKRLADKGAYIEECYSMYSIDNIPIRKISSQIRSVGARGCIISSDLGQRFSKNPDKGLEEFAALLIGEGISEEELRLMMVENPRRLIS